MNTLRTLHATEGQHIEMLELNTIREPVTHPNAYTLNPQKPCLWLQKACLWVLAKLGCNYAEPCVKTTRMQVRARDFTDELFRQRQALVADWRLPPAHILIGADDYDALLGEPGARELFDPISFTTKMGADRRVMNCKVTIVPWMTGMIILPRGFEL